MVLPYNWGRDKKDFPLFWGYTFYGRMWSSIHCKNSSPYLVSSVLVRHVCVDHLCWGGEDVGGVHQIKRCWWRQVGEWESFFVFQEGEGTEVKEYSEGTVYFEVTYPCEKRTIRQNTLRFRVRVGFLELPSPFCTGGSVMSPLSYVYSIFRRSRGSPRSDLTLRGPREWVSWTPSSGTRTSQCTVSVFSAMYPFIV